MSKDEIVAGLAEINAFCVVFIEHFKCESEEVKRWKECTAEAIIMLNEKE